MVTILNESLSSKTNHSTPRATDENLENLAKESDNEDDDDEGDDEEDDDMDDYDCDGHCDMEEDVIAEKSMEIVPTDGPYLRHRPRQDDKTEQPQGNQGAYPSSSYPSSRRFPASRLVSTSARFLMTLLGSPIRLLNSLPPRWRNWCIRGISGWALIFGFGFVIHMGPVALMLLSDSLAVGCYYEVTTISYNVHKAANVPLIRSLSWYYLFTLLHLFYGDTLIRHLNDYLWATDAFGEERSIAEDDAVGDVVGGGSSDLNRISEILEVVERFHPTTSFVLYVCGVTVGFLPLVLRRKRRRSGPDGKGRRKRSRGGDGSGVNGDVDGQKNNDSSSASATESKEPLSPASPEPCSTTSGVSSSLASSFSSTTSTTLLLKKQFVIFTWSHMALFFFLFPSHFAVLNISVGGHLWFLIPVSIVIFNDISAYIFGFFFGKTPLIALSPKKTWEGFLGSGFSTLLFGALFSGWYLDSILAKTLTLQQLESLTLKSGAAELRRRGVFGGGVGIDPVPREVEANLAPLSPAAGTDTSEEPQRQREIILRLDHFVCRVNVTGWNLRRKKRGSSSGRGGGVGSVDGGGSDPNLEEVGGKTFNWEAVAAATVCDRAAVFKLANYSLPETMTSIWKVLSGGAVREIELYPFQFHAFVFSIFGSLIAPFGGFFASGFKRAFNIKDFGAIIPGHGGLTDRFDCQLLMSFFVFVYHYSFIEGQYEGSSLASLKDGVVVGGGGGAGGFGRPRGSGIGGDPIGSSPLEIVKRVVQLEAKDQIWLLERMKETLGKS